MRLPLAAIIVILLVPLFAPAHVGVWGTSTYCDCTMNRPNGGQAFSGINAVGASCVPSVDGNKRPTACWANAACRSATGHSDPASSVGGIPIDLNNRLCEDFEAPTLRFNGTCSGDSTRYCVGDSDTLWNCTGAGTCNTNQWVGNGPPAFGPPWDTTGGGAGNRGANGYWRKTHGLDDGGISSFSWSSGTPASPTYGSACAFGVCTGATIWAPGNPWQPRTNDVSLLVIHDQDPWNTDADLGALNASGPLCPDGSRGACDDKMVGGNRVPPGGSGYMWATNFHSPTYPPNATTDATISHYGVTAILGYTSTSVDPPCGGGGPDPIVCGIWKQPWKHWEVFTSNGSLIKLDWLPGNVGYNAPGNWPLATSVGQFSGAWCSDAAIVRNVGRFECDPGFPSDSLLRMAPPDVTTPTADFPSGYTQTTHFPWDTLHCVQKEINALGSSSATVKVWLDGKLLQSVSNVNLSTATPYTGLFLTKYANTNDGGVPTVTTIYEYNDNFTFREGPPAPCPEMFVGAVAPPGPTWQIDSFSLTPSNCVQFQCADLADVAAAASGTATGTASWELDCDITGGYSGTAIPSCTGATCNVADLCDYSASLASTITAEIRSTREGVQATRQTSFVVSASAPTFPGGLLLGLNEPTQDVNNKPLQTLSSCEVKRFVNGVLLDTVFRPASGPGGGGRWPTDWASDLLVSQCGGKTLTGSATCTNSKGKSTTSSPSPIVTAACPEGLPKPPTFSMLGQIERLYADLMMAWR